MAAAVAAREVTLFLLAVDWIVRGVENDDELTGGSSWPSMTSVTNRRSLAFAPPYPYQSTFASPMAEYAKLGAETSYPTENERQRNGAESDNAAAGGGNHTRPQAERFGHHRSGNGPPPLRDVQLGLARQPDFAFRHGVLVHKVRSKQVHRFGAGRTVPEGPHVGLGVPERD